MLIFFSPKARRALGIGLRPRHALLRSAGIYIATPASQASLCIVMQHTRSCLGRSPKHSHVRSMVMQSEPCGAGLALHVHAQHSCAGHMHSSCCYAAFAVHSSATHSTAVLHRQRSCLCISSVQCISQLCIANPAEQD